MDIKKKIAEDISKNKVKLYMKGTPSFPECGFSKAVVDILSHYDIEFSYSNVLIDEQLRQGIKEYFDWPTIPQLIINGELVGGCDIILELHEQGELQKIFDEI